ncbi:MAG: Uma2 family endonuclease [Cyanophyceae cyanobacterium]
MAVANQGRSRDRVRWCLEDLDGLPDNGSRYEILDGALIVTRAPHCDHQDVAGRIYAELLLWSRQTSLGRPFFGPGVIFAPDMAVIPDVVWASDHCLKTGLDGAGHFTRAPELIVEVLSASEGDRRRDRETKRKLYGVQGVLEYWIADRDRPALEIYARQNGILERMATLLPGDRVTSPQLPGFDCDVAIFFE